MNNEILNKAKEWLSPFFDEETRNKVKYLIENDEKEIIESFYKDLEFGTGGMRGIMGVGDNRINKYTLGKNTQGLSNYLKEQFPNAKIIAMSGGVNIGVGGFKQGKRKSLDLAKNYGVNYVFAKPLDMDELLASVLTLCY